jgi:hypothetical protein
LNVSKQDAPKVVIMGILLLVIVVTLIVQVMNFNSGTGVVVASNAGADSAPLVPADTSGFESIAAPPGPTDPTTNPFRAVLPDKNAAPQPSAVGEDITPIPAPEIKPYVPTPEQVQLPSPPHLTGVLLGENPVAVFLVDGTSHTASVGEKLPNGYRVLAITDGAATVAFGNKRIELRIGE